MCSKMEDVTLINKKEKASIGILLVNLGTPNAADPKAVKAFLSEFLHDKRVVDLTRWLWCPLLHGVILPVRVPKVTKLYQSVWMKEGSPLMVYSRRQQQALENEVGLPVGLGMTYGTPSLDEGVKDLQARGCEKILVLPLYPQYSGTTTAAVFDKLAKAMKKHVNIPAFRFISHYYQEKSYLLALASSITAHWQKEGQPDHLLCSYHGIPQRYVAKGDPYAKHCEMTTQGLIKELGTDVAISMSYQSRFGREPWLQPYTDHTIEKLAKSGVKRLDIITPAFSVDCLETLEEIAKECKEVFIRAGGEAFHLIPCLNDDPAHINMMSTLIEKHTSDW